MQRKNIPNYVLARGISRVGFEQLLKDIRNAVIEEGLNEFCNYSELLNFIKEKDGANSEQWISEFEVQLNESTNVINENMAKIEGLFTKIFIDWEVYKQEHNIVEEVKEAEKIESEVPTDETKEEVVVPTDETKEEVVVPTVEEKIEEPIVEETKEEIKLKKDKSETEGDNNG